MRVCHDPAFRFPRISAHMRALSESRFQSFLCAVFLRDHSMIPGQPPAGGTLTHIHQDKNTADSPRRRIWTALTVAERPNPPSTVYSPSHQAHVRFGGIPVQSRPEADEFAGGHPRDHVEQLIALAEQQLGVRPGIGQAAPGSEPDSEGDGEEEA
jgi:hypothetical protein